jgi:hypothetical protein
MAEASASANEIVLESSPLAAAILRRLRERGPIRATPAALLGELSEIIGEHESHSPAWPRTAAGLSNALRRIAPALRRSGLSVDFGHDHAGRFIAIQQYAPIVAVVARDAPELFREEPPDIARVRSELRAALEAGRLDEIAPEIRTILDRLARGEGDESEVRRAAAILKEIHR